MKQRIVFQRCLRVLLGWASMVGWVGTGAAASQTPTAAAPDHAAVDLVRQASGPGLDATAVARIDSVFRDLDRTATPGCAAGVTLDAALVFADGYGSANLDHQIPITPQTVFYTGSVSKRFTAAAIALAAWNGHLSLDDDVRRWIPELPDYGKTITVRHLVHHTSGIRDYLTLQAIAGTPPGASDDEIIELLARQKALNFPPGARYLYSNSGYFLMSEIVGRATGSSLREFAHLHFFAPLGLLDTHFHDDPNHVVQWRATGYAPTDEKVDADGPARNAHRMEHWWRFAQVGSGGLYSNVVDLARWEAAFEAGDVGPPGFAASLLERGVLANGETLDYAFGLRISRFRGLPAVAHGGSLAGFRAQMLSFPDESTSIIVLCNVTDADPRGRAERVAEIVMGDRLESPAAATAPPDEPGGGEPPTLTAQELAEFVGTYRSDELDTDHRIRVEEGAPVLHGRGALTPSAPDVFTVGGGMTLRFERDGSGRITHYVLDAGRANGLIFRREAP